MELEDAMLLNDITFYFYRFNNKLSMNINKKNISNELSSHIEIILYHKVIKYFHHMSINKNCLNFHPIYVIFIKLKKVICFLWIKQMEYNMLKIFSKQKYIFVKKI